MPTKEDIILEYRVAVLEGLVEWMLNNGMFDKGLDLEERENMHNAAMEYVKTKYPHVEISFEWSQKDGSENCVRPGVGRVLRPSN
jgi:hypothetical protein